MNSLLRFKSTWKSFTAGNKRRKSHDLSIILSLNDTFNEQASGFATALLMKVKTEDRNYSTSCAPLHGGQDSHTRGHRRFFPE